MFVTMSHYYHFFITWLPGFTEEEEKITSLPESGQVNPLEASNVVSKVDLRCMVANSGSFMWEWTRAVLTSGVNQADLMQVSCGNVGVVIT